VWLWVNTNHLGGSRPWIADFLYFHQLWLANFAYFDHRLWLANLAYFDHRLWLANLAYFDRLWVADRVNDYSHNARI
jgi:hypothetical protein